MKRYKFSINGSRFDVNIKSLSSNTAVVNCNGQDYEVDILNTEKEKVSPKLKTTEEKEQVTQVSPTPAKSKKKSAGSKSIKAPIPGVIIKILVNKGDQVESGKVVAVMEAMKMENDILSTGDGKIKSINVKEGDSILEGGVIMELED
ncbi:MAG: biotin/lipoyl-containing protein [Candidatus Marinimicrobia bacterium]|nr:biotin/lipoyl-containing protein [Candidatus Neomarinimicrobiota bacterium]